jgi:NitT/TauT family transport system permease protein
VAPIVTGALLLALWWLAVRVSGTKVFPSPLAVARGFAEVARKGLLLRFVGASLARVAAGYGAAVLTGIPLGVAMGTWPLLSRAANPVIQLLRPISPIAWIPIAIVLLGVGEATPIFLIFLAALFPVVVTTMNGVRSVAPMFLRASANFGLPRVMLFRRVVLPSALPEMLTGLRISLGIAWLVLVAAEMVAVDTGVGYLIIDSRNAGKRYDLVVTGMLLIGAIGLLLDLAMRRVERIRSVRWGFTKGD